MRGNNGGVARVFFMLLNSPIISYLMLLPGDVDLLIKSFHFRCQHGGTGCCGFQPMQVIVGGCEGHRN